MSLDPVLTRGAAATLLALSAVMPLGAQAAGSIQVRPRKDSVFVRIIGDSSQRIRLDSLIVLSRALEDEAPLSVRGIELRRELETMMTTLRARGGGVHVVLNGPEGMRQFETPRQFTGWIGLVTSGSVPHDEWSRDGKFFVRYFAYPSIISVDPNSPAQRAGIVPGDVLVAYDGADVVGREINVTQTFVPDRRLSVTVRREGENREFGMTVQKAPQRVFFRRLEPGEMPIFPAMPSPAEGMRIERARTPGGSGGAGGAMAGSRAVRPSTDKSYGYDFPGGVLAAARGMFMGPEAVFGASLITLKPELATALKLEMGVLVEQVPEETPAYKAGLRAGDVITNVAGVPVSTVRDVRVVLVKRAENRTVGFQIVRDKKSKLLTLKW